MNTNDGAVLLADNLHDTGSTEDRGLTVTSQVVLSGLNVLSAELLLSLGLGVTNRSNLRVTEGDLGDVDVFNDGGVQASDFLSNEDTLLVTAVSQLNAGDDVTNSVDVANAGVQALVSQDEAAIHGDALLLVAHVCGVRATTNSDQNDLCLEDLAVSQGDLSTVSVLLNLLEEGAGVELDAALLERTLQNLDDCRVLVGNQVRQALDDGDVNAHSVPHGCELATNHAATEHDSALGQVVHLQCLSGGQHATLNGQTEGLGDRTGCQDNVLTLVLNTTDGDGVLSGQLTLAGDNLYALHLQQACKTLELTGDDAVLVIANLAHLDGLQYSVNANLGRLACIFSQLSSVQVRLGGDTAGVQAGAADLFLLDQADGEAQLACANSCRVASGTAAEDEDVEFLSHDIAPLHSCWG